MEEEVLQPVLSEVLEDLKELKQQMVETGRMLKFLCDKVAEVGAWAPAARTGAVSMETEVVVAVWKAGFEEIKSVVEAQPKTLTKQFRIVLFPEYDAREHSKVVGKIFLWLLIFTISTYLFVLGKEFIEANLTSRQNKFEESKYKKAWIFFYSSSKRSIRQKMDSAWSRVTNLPG